LELTFFKVFFKNVWENPGKIPSHPKKFCLLLHLRFGVSMLTFHHVQKRVLRSPIAMAWKKQKAGAVESEIFSL